MPPVRPWTHPLGKTQTHAAAGSTPSPEQLPPLKPLTDPFDSPSRASSASPLKPHDPLSPIQTLIDPADYSGPQRRGQFGGIGLPAVLDAKPGLGDGAQPGVAGLDHTDSDRALGSRPIVIDRDAVIDLGLAGEAA